MNEEIFISILVAQSKADLAAYLKSPNFKIRQYAVDRLKLISSEDYKPILSLEELNILEEGIAI